MPGPSTPVLSCVVDTDPRFHAELLRWFTTATRCAGVSPDRLVVHAITPGASDILRFVEASGANVVTIDSFDPRSPHCNKISGALALAASLPDGDGAAALLDTDMLILSDPTVLDPPPGILRGKRVDLANPPIDMLNMIFDEAALPKPPSLPPPEATVLGNVNGGLYVLNRRNLQSFAQAWSNWARWLMDRPTLLGTYAIHVDQVAACLATADLGIEVELVDQGWNLPTHLRELIPDDVDNPRLLHYHRCVDSNGFVELTGQPTVDRAISAANAQIETAMQLLSAR